MGEGHEGLLGHHNDDHEPLAGVEGPAAEDDSVSEASQIVDSHFGLQHSTVRVVLLVMALSLHAVFEGLSLGMIPDVTALLQVGSCRITNHLTTHLDFRGTRYPQNGHRLQPRHPFGTVKSAHFPDSAVLLHLCRANHHWRFYRPNHHGHLKDSFNRHRSLCVGPPPGNEELLRIRQN